MLELKGVSKVYRVGTFGGKELRAVHNFNLAIDRGEVVSLIGESGSGKSTIGKMILRLIPISAGQILFNGGDVSRLEGSELKEYYRKVQGVFQDPFSSYNPIFKADRIFSMVKEEFFPGMPEAEWKDRLEDSLCAVGLNPAHVLHKYPHQLSGGQLQRFLIARALLLETHFLVADEIISMLDASTRIDVLNLLADLKSHGLSILFITHDLNLGYYISERAVILYRGCVVEMGSTAKIFENPLHPYTKMLMASVPRLDRKWEESYVEMKRSESEGRYGCPFYSRCPVADSEACTWEIPPLIELEDNHFAACVKFQLEKSAPIQDRSRL